MKVIKYSTVNLIQLYWVLLIILNKPLICFDKSNVCAIFWPIVYNTTWSVNICVVFWPHIANRQAVSSSCLPLAMLANQRFALGLPLPYIANSTTANKLAYGC